MRKDLEHVRKLTTDDFTYVSLNYTKARPMARLAADRGDDGANDLIVSEIIRTNELHVWFMAAHIADVPLAHAM